LVYSIEFRPAVLRSLKKYPRKDLQRIKKRIENIAQNLPDPASTKMKGRNDFHKVRVGDYRLIYEIHSDILIILVVKIGHRKDVYKQLP
jgi:mRNA interferase RelE/StbE